MNLSVLLVKIYFQKTTFSTNNQCRSLPEEFDRLYVEDSEMICLPSFLQLEVDSLQPPNSDFGRIEQFHP